MPWAYAVWLYLWPDGQSFSESSFFFFETVPLFLSLSVSLSDFIFLSLCLSNYNMTVSAVYHVVLLSDHWLGCLPVVPSAHDYKSPLCCFTSSSCLVYHHHQHALGLRGRWWQRAEAEMALLCLVELLFLNSIAGAGEATVVLGAFCPNQPAVAAALMTRSWPLCACRRLSECVS